MRTFVIKLGMASGLFCLASLAQAQTTFNVTGTITAGTCTIGANNGSSVNVGSFNSSLFTGSYQSGFVNFNLSYSNCGVGIKTLTLKLTGTPDKTTGGNVSYWDNTLPGAPFELKDTKANVTLLPTGSTLINIANPATNGTYQLAAQFHQTGTLTKTGTGTATVTVNASYQ